MKYRFTKNDVDCWYDSCGYLHLKIVLDGELKKKTYLYYSKKEALKKFQEEFGVYPKDYKPIGVYCLSNFGGLAVMEIENCFHDYAIVCDCYGDGYKNITRNKIYYNNGGSPYFLRNNKRWYLDDFMRV